MTLFNETGHSKHHRLLSVSDLYSPIASGTWQLLWQPKMFPVFPNAFPEKEPQIYFIIAYIWFRQRLHQVHLNAFNIIPTLKESNILIYHSNLTNFI